MTSMLWERCVYHRSAHTSAFFEKYLPKTCGTVLLIAGSGFDPRSTSFAEIVAKHAARAVAGCFIREERPNPKADLVALAEENERRLVALVPNCSVHEVDIFAEDGAVVAGRNAIAMVRSIELGQVSDVIVDLSALSIGVAFPIVRLLYEGIGSENRNLHLVVEDTPAADSAIVGMPNERAESVHGFKGDWGLDEHSQSARLWLPQLDFGTRPMLERVRQRIEPHAVCPILPFPCSDDPRLPDQLIEHFAADFTGSWQVDARDIIYADQRSPLDLYRSVLRLDTARSKVFAEIGGSQIVLSPVGSKAMAIGALMAALEREFTVMTVEALDYAVDVVRLRAAVAGAASEFVHVWLRGDAYADHSAIGTSR